MHSLIIAIESIRLIEVHHLGQSLFRQYKNHIQMGLSESSYSIPSLIWPPPISVIELFNIRGEI